ncbi:hypothetical protein CYMTET_18785 [Cymbomonas tetramitiformis]|uniref:AP2/ERF domain-containing protein n=1 Tax=Cymbomonas tetramitiformis TaxID=36881 RepID=A0AAE0L5U9_9CHLO|nr:hypothetical protein CYMTET_18785 [Cymbomonas tetramitiformis]
MVEELFKAVEGTLFARLEDVRDSLPTGAILSEHNVAYDRGRGTQHAHIIDVMVHEDALFSGKTLRVLQVDWFKWFDKLPRETAIASMVAKGFPPEAVEMIAECYSGMRACISTQWGDTDFFERDGSNGLMQGGVGSPNVSKHAQDPAMRALGSRDHAYVTAYRTAVSLVAFSDDGRNYDDGSQAATAELERITGLVLPAMCIGVAWTKAIAYVINRGDAPEPLRLWHYEAGTGCGERVSVPVSAANEPGEFLGTKTLPNRERSIQAPRFYSFVARYISQRFEWEQMRAVVAPIVVNSVTFNPLEVRTPSEELHAWDRRFGLGVASSLRMHRYHSRQGFYATHGLGIPCFVTEMLAAFARELLVGLGELDELAGTLLREGWQRSLDNPGKPTVARFVVNTLAGYGFMVRDNCERFLSRVLDVIQVNNGHQGACASAAFSKRAFENAARYSILGEDAANVRKGLLGIEHAVWHLPSKWKPFLPHVKGTFSPSAVARATVVARQQAALDWEVEGRAVGLTVGASSGPSLRSWSLPMEDWRDGEVGDPLLEELDCCAHRSRRDEVTAALHRRPGTLGEVCAMGDGSYVADRHLAGAGAVFATPSASRDGIVGADTSRPGVPVLSLRCALPSFYGTAKVTNHQAEAWAQLLILACAPPGIGGVIASDNVASLRAVGWAREGSARDLARSHDITLRDRIAKRAEAHVRAHAGGLLPEGFAKGAAGGQQWPSWKALVEGNAELFSCKDAEAFASDVGGLTPLWVRGHQDVNGKKMLPNRFLALLNHHADGLADEGVKLAAAANADEPCRVRYPRGGPRFFMAHFGNMVTSDPSAFVREQGERSALDAWGRCKQQGAAAAAIDDLWISSLDPSRLRILKAPDGVVISGLPEPGSEFFRISAWRQWMAVGGSWSARVRDSPELRAEMLTVLQTRGAGTVSAEQRAAPAMAGEVRGQGNSQPEPPAVSAAVEDLLASAPPAALGGEDEGARIKDEVRLFLNKLSHLLLEDEELDAEVRQGVDGFTEQLPSTIWGREDASVAARSAVEDMARCIPPIAQECPSLGTGTQEAVETFFAGLSQSLLAGGDGGEVAVADCADGAPSLAQGPPSSEDHLGCRAEAGCPPVGGARDTLEGATPPPPSPCRAQASAAEVCPLCWKSKGTYRHAIMVCPALQGMRRSSWIFAERKLAAALRTGEGKARAARGADGQDDPPPCLAAAAGTPAWMDGLRGRGEAGIPHPRAQCELAHDLAYRGLVAKAVILAVVDPGGVLDDKEFKAAGNELVNELMAVEAPSSEVEQAQLETEANDIGAARGVGEDVETGDGVDEDGMEHQVEAARDDGQAGAGQGSAAAPQGDACPRTSGDAQMAVPPSSGGAAWTRRRPLCQAERDADRQRMIRRRLTGTPALLAAYIRHPPSLEAARERLGFEDKRGRQTPAAVEHTRTALRDLGISYIGGDRRVARPLRTTVVDDERCVCEMKIRAEECHTMCDACGRSCEGASVKRDVCALCETPLAGNEVGVASARPGHTSELIGVSRARDMPGVFRAVFRRTLLTKFSGANAEVEAARAYDRKAREVAAAEGVRPLTNFESEDSEAMGNGRAAAERQREETRTVEARRQAPHKWSFFRGVTWVPVEGKYLAQIREGESGSRRRKRLDGRFLEEREAALAYDKAAREVNAELGITERDRHATNFLDEEGTVRAPPPLAQGSRFFGVVQMSRSTMWQVRVKGPDGKLLAAGPPYASEMYAARCADQVARGAFGEGVTHINFPGGGRKPWWECPEKLYAVFVPPGVASPTAGRAVVDLDTRVILGGVTQAAPRDRAPAGGAGGHDSELRDCADGAGAATGVRRGRLCEWCAPATDAELEKIKALRLWGGSPDDDLEQGNAGVARHVPLRRHLVCHILDLPVKGAPPDMAALQGFMSTDGMAAYIELLEEAAVRNNIPVVHIYPSFGVGCVEAAALVGHKARTWLVEPEHGPSEDRRVLDRAVCERLVRAELVLIPVLEEEHFTLVLLDAGGVWVLDSCPAPNRARRRRMADFVAGAVCFAVGKCLGEIEIEGAPVPALSKEWWRRHRAEADAHAGSAPTAGDWMGDVAGRVAKVTNERCLDFRRRIALRIIDKDHPLLQRRETASGNAGGVPGGLRPAGGGRMGAAAGQPEVTIECLFPGDPGRPPEVRTTGLTMSEFLRVAGMCVGNEGELWKYITEPLDLADDPATIRFAGRQWELEPPVGVNIDRIKDEICSLGGASAGETHVARRDEIDTTDTEEPTGASRDAPPEHADGGGRPTLVLAESGAATAGLEEAQVAVDSGRATVMDMDAAVVVLDEAPRDVERCVEARPLRSGPEPPEIPMFGLDWFRGTGQREKSLRYMAWRGWRCALELTGLVGVRTCPGGRALRQQRAADEGVGPSGALTLARQDRAGRRRRSAAGGSALEPAGTESGGAGSRQAVGRGMGEQDTTPIRLLLAADEGEEPSEPQEKAGKRRRTAAGGSVPEARWMECEGAGTRQTAWRGVDERDTTPIRLPRAADEGACVSPHAAPAIKAVFQPFPRSDAPADPVAHPPPHPAAPSPCSPAPQPQPHPPSLLLSPPLPGLAPSPPVPFLFLSALTEAPFATPDPPRLLPASPSAPVDVSPLPLLLHPPPSLPHEGKGLMRRRLSKQERKGRRRAKQEAEHASTAAEATRPPTSPDPQ